jgi:HEAT repeats/Domain of unknown function (DUF4214)
MLRSLARPLIVIALTAILSAALGGRGAAQGFGPEVSGAAPLQPFEVNAIQALREDPDAASRRGAARELGRRGSTAVVPHLARSAAYDPDREVRIEAGDSIARIRRRVSAGWTGGPLQPASIPQLVDSWYRLYLNRPAEPQGMRDQIARLRRGDSPEEIQAGSLGSDEFYQLHGSRRGAWIAALYTDVLDRYPSRREIGSWMETLDRSGGSRDRTALEFLRAARRELAEQRP